MTQMSENRFFSADSRRVIERQVVMEMSVVLSELETVQNQQFQSAQPG
jgi:hypothetical protein